jgi:DNA-binding transcriptional LysR family regulator
MADLSLLRTFLAVYRAGSLSAAAPLLGLTQPAVTKQLRALETLLDRPLFTRLARGVTPTPAADALAQSVMGHVDALEAALAASAARNTELAGSVLLGGPAELVSARVLPALARVHTLGLHVHLTLGLPAGLVAALVSGALDLAIITQRVPRRDVQYDPLFDETFVLVGAPEWADRARRHGRVDQSRLATMPLVAYADDLPIVRRYWREVFGERLAASASIVVPDLRGVVEAVRAGAGMSVVPRYLVAELLASGELQQLHAPAHPPSNRIYLAGRRGDARAGRVEYVHALLRQAAAAWHK